MANVGQCLHVWGWGCDEQNINDRVGQLVPRNYPLPETGDESQFRAKQVDAYGCNHAVVSVEGDVYTGRVSESGIFHLVQIALAEGNVEKVVCGGQHIVALTGSGALYSWGAGSEGQLGHGDTEGCHVPKRIAALEGHVVTDVAAGHCHCIAVTDKGDVFVWGCGGDGRLGLERDDSVCIPTLLNAVAKSHVVRVSCGAIHSICITASGQLYTWGGGQYGLGGTGVREELGPHIVDSLKEEFVLMCVASQSATAALCKSGAVYTWGLGDHGQLGHATCRDELRPRRVAVLDGKRIVHLVGGGFHFLALDKRFNVYGWGWNAFGQLGLGSTLDQCSPVLVDLPTPSLYVGAGTKYSFAVSMQHTWHELAQQQQKENVRLQEKVSALQLQMSNLTSSFEEERSALKNELHAERTSNRELQNMIKQTQAHSNSLQQQLMTHLYQQNELMQQTQEEQRAQQALVGRAIRKKLHLMEKQNKGNSSSKRQKSQAKTKQQKIQKQEEMQKQLLIQQQHQQQEQMSQQLQQMQEKKEKQRKSENSEKQSPQTGTPDQVLELQKALAAQKPPPIPTSHEGTDLSGAIEVPDISQHDVVDDSGSALILPSFGAASPLVGFDTNFLVTPTLQPPIDPLLMISSPETESPSASENSFHSTLCYGCGSAQIDTIFLPCTHKVLCSKCSESRENCPVCQQPVHDRLVLD